MANPPKNHGKSTFTFIQYTALHCDREGSLARKALSERIVIKKKHPELLTFRWQLCNADRRNDNTFAKYGVIKY